MKINNNGIISFIHYMLLFFRKNEDRKISVIKLFTFALQLLNLFKMPLISEKGKAMPASPIRKLVPYAEAAKKKGERYTI